MKFWSLVGSALVAGALAFGASAADPVTKDAKDAKPAKAAGAKKEKNAEKVGKPAAAADLDGPRYPKQFNRIVSLTEEQKKKLQDLAGKAAAEKAAVDTRMKQEYLGVLTDEQRKELQTIEQGGSGKKAAKKPDVQKTAKKPEAAAAPKEEKKS